MKDLGPVRTGEPLLVKVDHPDLPRSDSDRANLLCSWVSAAENNMLSRSKVSASVPSIASSRFSGGGSSALKHHLKQPRDPFSQGTALTYGSWTLLHLLCPPPRPASLIYLFVVVLKWFKLILKVLWTLRATLGGVDGPERRHINQLNELNINE